MVNFEVNATGGTGYSWQKKADGNSTWVSIAGANTNRLDYGPVKLDENGTLFRATITGGGDLSPVNQPASPCAYKKTSLNSNTV